ncbi:p450-domain-containing protein [Aspergillus heteromorphus CBS 117.55]|uniref:Benzoate 4-monooxygenase bphA n=1 Tax=Aspergillus heteromorphus CBS 117.55 TaxID=1448321 RepID=A0A317WRJ4_9EURO|nr:p450-domain-containing protein [Aspergillus heteromorphus CBS 117.55]PWY89076.1 p450-domain-containing protein [Aspergillus heteromorphus CBS 117.55]
MAELFHPAPPKCPPLRQVQGTRLNTIPEDEREEQYSEKAVRVLPTPNPTPQPLPQLKLKTSGLPLVSARLHRFFSPISAGSMSSCSDTEWQPTDEESETSDDCTSFASTRPTSLVSPTTRASVVSPISRNRYPSLTIPSSASSPIPPTPPSKIPVSPAALSLLGHPVPAVHAPPSLDGSVSSDQVSGISAPATPDLQSLPDNDWNDAPDAGAPNLEVDPEVQSIEIAIEGASEDWQHVLGRFPRIPGRSSPIDLGAEPPREDTPSDRGVCLPAGALEMLRHISFDGTPDPWSETSEGNEEIAGDATPASDISGYSFSRLSIPSPGGFFASLAPRARHTWSIPRGNKPPSSAIAENFYKLPFSRDDGEVVEQVTAVYDPPTAIWIPPEIAPQDTQDDAVFPEPEVDHDSIPVDSQYERDENYDTELREKAMSGLDRTSVWLAAQASYLSALHETNPVNMLDGEDPKDAAKIEPPPQRVRKMSIPSGTIPEAPSSQPSAQASRDSIYWRGFQAVHQQSSSQDTFVHRNTRFDAVQSSRLGLTNTHISRLRGSYEVTRPERPAYKGPFSLAPRNSTMGPALVEKAQFSMVEKEQAVLSQLREPMWAMDALKYLNGGSLIVSPALKRLSGASHSRKVPPRQLRVLDLGGHASCEWGWQLAHDHPNVKVYTVVTEHQDINPGIKGPPNHRHLSVSQLWKLPFSDSKFDVISARSLPALLKKQCPTGEAQDEYDLCLKECRRCLKPGGYLEFFIMDAQITRAGPQASATSGEFASNLTARGYDPTPTKGFLTRLQRNFADVKRAWMFLPMGTEPVKPEFPRETPDPRVKSLMDEYEAVHGPIGSTADIASVTGILGGWLWEQWLVKLQMEMGIDRPDLLAGIGRKRNSFFKTLTNQTVTIELKNDIRIRGTLKSVDQYLNIKLDDVDVLDLDKYPHLSSVKNMFIRGSVKADGPPKATSRQSRITQFATKTEGGASASASASGKDTENGGSGGGGLFLEGGKGFGKMNGGGRERERERERERTPDDFWDQDKDGDGSGSGNGGEVVEIVSGDEDWDGGRYNENGGGVKRRRVEDSGSGDRKEEGGDGVKIGSTTTSSKKRQISGPFIDESDSEEEEDLERFREVGDSSLSENNGDGNEHDRKESPNYEDAKPDTPAPSVREATSLIDNEEDANFDDLEDEFRDEELLDTFQDEDEDEDGDVDVDGTGLDGTGDAEDFGCEAPVCPICQTVLAGLTDTDVSVHVNDCLDGKPMRLSKSEPPEKEPEKEPTGLTRADRAAVARPAQRDPYASGVAGTRSAFSKLMSGNAEDTAWAAAAANEVASRGKQAYQRTCPFYKIIPGFSICVDAFRYGAVEGCQAYFLSHFHSDHYIGLAKSWRHGPIYCSRATANLVSQQLKVDRKWLVPLEFEKTAEVPGTGVQVTLIEANHCPGSAIFLFEKPMGSGPTRRTHRVLHCGDFRASPLHVQHALLRPDVVDAATGQLRQQRIDACYLDTTYLSPRYAFPCQEDVIQACADLCVELDGDDGALGRAISGGGGGNSMLSKFVSTVTGSRTPSGSASRPGRLLVVIGTYSIGKERICIGIARALKSKIYATAAKQRICACLEDEELSALLTDNPREAQVHMQTLFEIRAETLTDYLDSLKPHFTRVVGFRPTGWTYRGPAGRTLEQPAVSAVLHAAQWRTGFSARDLTAQRGSTRESACFGVPYSEHSSFRELTMFCCALRIGRVIPTVNVGSRPSRERMKGWMERWEAEKRRSGLFRVEGSRCQLVNNMLALLLSPYGVYLGLAALAVYYIVPYVQRWHLHDIPSPGFASVSNLWLLLQTRRGHRFKTIDDAHKQHGKLLRIAPRHTSIADDAAIQAVYGHGNGFLKSDFYDAFVSIHRGLFNTRDRVEHSRKRKTVSHTFSMKSIGQFEQYIHGNVELFVQQWSRLAQTQRDPRTGFVTLDALNWFNYLAFDIIGDLAFGAPFGMLDKGKDYAEMRKTPDAPPSYVQAVEVLNRRGEVSATLGCLPALKPYAKYLPDRFFRDGIQAVEDLAGIAVARVNERLRPEVMANNTRVDLLARLMEGKDQNGEKLGRAELTAEALTQLIAGSDTTSNTSCAILYWCMSTPGVIEKLQQVLDEAIPADIDVPTHSMVKEIPYLQYIIWETMRIHSTSAMGLPREIPAGTPPINISGHTFLPGDVVSVPSYTIHRSKEIWGADAEQFVPERWDPARLTARQKAAFIPFSTGPRACVGRNVAEMELLVICATVFRLFEFEMQQSGPMETREGFLRKPVGLIVGMKRREIVSAAA